MRIHSSLCSAERASYRLHLLRTVSSLIVQSTTHEVWHVRITLLVFVTPQSLITNKATFTGRQVP